MLVLAEHLEEIFTKNKDCRICPPSLALKLLLERDFSGLLWTGGIVLQTMYIYINLMHGCDSTH